MASEMLNEILSAESAAAAAELDAKKHAENIIIEAKLKAEEIITAARKNAQKAAESVLLSAKSRAAEIENEAVGQANAEADRIKSAAIQKRESAIIAVSEFILPSDKN